MTLSPQHLAEIAARVEAATPGPWRSMRAGNQYVNCRYLPTSKCVGTSRVEGIVRPWNPHAVVSFTKLDAAEEARFLDTDADFIAHARQDVPDMLAYIAELERENAELRTQIEASRDDD